MLKVASTANLVRSTLTRRFSSSSTRFVNASGPFQPSNKAVCFVGEVAPWSKHAFAMTRQQFPNAWGFLWSTPDTNLSTTMMTWPERLRENAYSCLVDKDLTSLEGRMVDSDRECLTDGMMILGGEDGKKVISEAFQYLGTPVIVSYKSDLVFMDLKDKEPLSWIVRASPAIFNIHPGPPEIRGAGLYIPYLVRGESEYGVTVHIVNENIDDGPIIFVRRFTIPAECTTSQLQALTAKHCNALLEKLLLQIKDMNSVEDIPTSSHYSWGSFTSTRRDVRKMIQELIETYGEQGHPALL